MRSFAVFLFLFLFSSQVHSQDISAGVRAGGSVWRNADAGFKILNPEIGMFVRAEPIKRLSLDLGFTAYKLKRDFSYQDVSHTMGCKELNLAVQYNYLRVIKKALKLYAGVDYSHIFSSFEIKSISNPTQPILTPYVSNNSSFRFHMLGINQSFTYPLSKNITAMTTFSYKINISELNGLYPPQLPGL